MKVIELKLKDDKSNEVYVFNATVVSANYNNIDIIINKDSKNLNKINERTRFIIGDVFPRAYIISGINEFFSPLFFEKGEVDDVIEFELKLDLLKAEDDIKNKIAVSNPITKYISKDYLKY